MGEKWIFDLINELMIINNQSEWLDKQKRGKEEKRIKLQEQQLPRL